MNRYAWLATSCLLLAPPAPAADVVVALRHAGGPVADGVVSLHGPAPAAGGGLAVMDQRNTAFEPGVLAIQAGTRVSFPNSDTVQHQVYSFSPAKPFELPLYAGTPPAPLHFDRPGVVVVGCNIHDWMIGYIVVLDTPHFARSGADGGVRLDVPPGRYTLRAWHARLPAPGIVEQAVEVGPGGLQRVLDLALGPPPPERRGSERLRALQERLRRVGPAGD